MMAECPAYSLAPKSCVITVISNKKIPWTQTILYPLDEVSFDSKALL